MQIDLTTPALLFSTISLLLLAYTNRFLALANVIRKLHSDHQAAPKDVYLEEIANLRKRVHLIRDMQTLGVGSLLLCTLCVMLIFWGLQSIAKGMFVIALLMMVCSLTLSIIEIRMSVGALNLHLRDLERESD